MSDTISTPVNPEPSADSAPALGLAEIQNAVRVIDFAAEQGAFKGWAVIEQVLTVRNRLNDFLKAVSPGQEISSENTPEPAA